MLGIAFAMVLSVATVAMFDSIDYIMDKAFTEVERWDIMAAFDAPFGSARVAEIRAPRRASSACRWRSCCRSPCRVGGAEEDVVVTAMSPDADFHGFDPVSGAAPAEALAAGDLVLSASTAAKLGVAPGTAVEVDSPLVDDPVTLRVGALSDEMLGQPAYLSLDAASSSRRRRQPLQRAVPRRRPGPGEPDPRRDLRHARRRQRSGEGGPTCEQLKTWLELFDFFGVVLLGFGAALAFVVVFTTFTANVTERTREIATMRTIGEDNLRLTVMITLENLAIAIAGDPAGHLAGHPGDQRACSHPSTSRASR